MTRYFFVYHLARRDDFSAIAADPFCDHPLIMVPASQRSKLVIATAHVPIISSSDLVKLSVTKQSPGWVRPAFDQANGSTRAIITIPMKLT